jgi:Ca2+-binding RTX toxin-like protein
MLLTSWVRNFRQSLKTRRRPTRRDQRLQTQAWNGMARASRNVELLEDRSLLTALVIDQNFVATNPGVINITNATIDQNSDSIPEFDEIIINNVVLDGNLGAGINISLSDLNIDRIGIQELTITGNSLGAGVNISLNNVDLGSLVIDRSNITSANGGGIDIDLIDVQLPELTVYQTTIAGGLNEGLAIDLISTTRDASIDELDISESIIDGVTITAQGLTRSVIDADPSNPVQLTVVDYGLQAGTRVTVDDIVGIEAANTATTVSPVLTVNPISGLLEPDENLLTLDGVDGAGGFYQDGGTLTVFTTIGSARITENTITGATGNDGVQLSFSNTRTTDVIIQDNPVIRSLIFDLTDSPVDELTIRNNADVAADRPQVDGMRFNLDGSTLTNLVIDNNIVTGDGASGASGIVFDAIDSNVLGMITNNTVTNTIGNGLQFNGTASDEFVAENRGPLVFDFALRTTTTRLAAGVDAAATSINVIDGNQFQAQQYLLIENEQVFVQSVVGNTLTVVRGERGTLPAPHLAEVDVKSVTNAAAGVKNGIVGNTFTINDGAGIFSALTPNTALLADIESNTFIANENRAIDFAVRNTSSDPGKLARGGISRTSTTLNTTDASVFSNFLLPFNVMVEGEEMTVTAIDGNALTVERGVNDTMAKFHETNTDVIPTNGDGLVLNIGGSSTVQGNFFDQNVGGSIHLELQDSAAGTFNIQNNIINGTLDSAGNNDGDAIEIELTNVEENVEATNILRRSTIDSNLLGVAGVTPLSLPISAVLMVFQVDDGSIFSAGETVQVDGERVLINSIAGNTLSVTRGVNGTLAVDHSAGVLVTPISGGNQGRGIEFSFVEVSALEDLQITNNVIANNDDDGIRFFRTDDGITRTVNPADGQTRAVTVRGNTITANASAPIADVQIAAGTSIVYAAGVEVQVLNGTGDEFDITIDSNLIYNTGFGVTGLNATDSVNGINLRTEADARIKGDITNNEVRFNLVDGLSTTERANANSDLRDVSANLFGNDFSDNGDDGIDISVRSGENQVMVIGQEGTDSQGRSLRNTINRNFDAGIEITSTNNFVAIINNDIDANGTGGSQVYGTATGETALTGSGIRVIGTGSQIAIKANSIDFNAGAGIDIQNGGLFTVRNNSLTFNENDGIEFDGNVQATILNNFVASNQGRGIDILVEPGGGAGERNYLIGNGQEVGRNVIVGNNLEGLYYVVTADAGQDQNLDSTVALASSGAANAEVNAIINIDTNTVTDNGVGTAGTATGIYFRIGSQAGNFGTETLATTISSGNEGDAWDRFRATVDPFLPTVGTSTDSSGYGTIGSEQENANGRTNARLVNNTFDGNFGDDVRFEAYESTVDPQGSIGAWTSGAFFFVNNGYQQDPLSRLNLVFEGNTGNGLDAFGIGNTASYFNDEQVFKRRDGISNANLTPVPDADGAPPFGPWPSTTSTVLEHERVVYRVPSRTHINNPLGNPLAIRSPFVPPRSGLLPDVVNVEPDSIFTVIDIQDTDIGNGIVDLLVSVAPNPFYPAGLPFPELGGGTGTTLHALDQGLFPVVEISGVEAIGGGIHTANGNFQVYDVDPVAHTFRLRGTGGHEGPGYLMGGQVAYNQNPPINNEFMIDDPDHGGLPFDQAFTYPGSGEPTFRISQGFDTVGQAAANEFTFGTNFTDTFSHPRAGIVGNLNVFHLIGSNAPLVSNPWGIWTENTSRSGGISFVQPDPADPMNRILITAPNHQLTEFRRVQTSDILGVPDANSTEFIRVIDVNNFSIPVEFIGVYGGGGSWETVDDSFPTPAAPTFPLSDVSDVTPDPRTSNSGPVTLQFTEDVDNVDVDDLFLTRDGVPVDISSIAVTQVAGSEYEIDLTSVTQAEGLYELIVDVQLPTADIVDISPDPSLDPIGEVVINFTEDVTGVDIFDFTLTRDINDGQGSQPVDLSEIGANLEVEQITRSQYTVDLSSVTNEEGLYRLSLLAPQTIGIDLLDINAQNEVVFNAVQHGLSTGHTVIIEGIVGNNLGLNTFLNGSHRIIVDDADNFRLADLILANVVTADDMLYDLSQASISIDSGIIDRVGRRFSLETKNGVIQPADASDIFVIAAQSPTGQIADITPDPRNSPVNDVFFNFSEPVVVTSVGVSDFTLTRNIGFGPFPVSIAAGIVTPLDADVFGFASRFVLSNLGGATSASGDYRLTLTTTDSTRIQDRQGAFLVFPDFDDWTLTTVGPAPLIQPIFPDPTTTPVGLVRFTFNEGVDNVDLANANTHFTLTRDAGDGNGPQQILLLDSSNQPLIITPNSATDFEMDLTPVTSDAMGNAIDGTYTLTLNRLSGISAQGDSEELQVDAVDSWIQDGTAPTADILDVDPDPRIRDAGLVFIEFDEPVTGIDRFSAATDFTLTRDIGDGNGFQNVTLIGQRVRALNARDVNGNSVLPFDPQTIFSTQYVLDLSATNLTDIDGTYVLSLDANGSIVDTTGNQFTASTSDTWILVPKGPISGIDDIIFTGNTVTVDSNDLWFNDTSVPMIVPGTVDITPDPRSTSVGFVTINFTEDVTGFNLTDLVLSRDTGTGAQQIPLTGLNLIQVDPSRYTIDLNLVTGGEGTYTLFVDGSNSLIQDLAGNPLQTGLITLDTWMVENIGPSASLNITPDPRTTPANNILLSFTKDVDAAQVDLTDLRLERDTGSGFSTVTITSGSVTANSPMAGFDDSYTIDLTALTNVEGLYRVTLLASDSGIVDQAGIELGADTSTTWTLDNTAPLGDIIDVFPDPRLTEVDIINLLFNEGVTGVDISDFELTLDNAPVDISTAPFVEETARRFTVDLTNFTTANGTYELRLLSTGGIADLGGNLLVDDAAIGIAGVAAQDIWFKGADGTNPTVDIIDVSSPRSITAGVVAFNFSEDVTGVDTADLTLTFNGSTVDISGATVTNLPGSASQYTIDLTDLTTDAGMYVLSVVTTDLMTPIRDASLNPLTVGDANTWTTQNIDPFAEISPISPNPRLRPVGVVTVTFLNDVDVDGVDITDFSLTRDTGTGPQPVSLRGIEVMQSPNGASEYLIDLTKVSGGDGDYRFTLNPVGSGITAISTGNPLLSDAFQTWTTVTTISVNTFTDTADVAPGDGIVADAMNQISLRAAVMEASTLPGDDVIVLGAGTYSLGIGGDGEEFAASGDLDIFDTQGTLTIRGAGAGLTTINAGNIERVFHVTNGGSLILDGVTITGGLVEGSQDGAGLRNDAGTVEIRNSVITGNTSLDDGGGINNAGTMTIINSTISNNSATNNGGAIRNIGNLTISNSLIGGSVDDVAMTDTRNVAGLNGGGIFNVNGATLSIDNSTISGNVATQGSGGAAFNLGTLDLTNVTIVSNDAGQRGGGLSASGGTATLQNVLIIGNTSTNVGPDISVPGSTGAINSAGSFSNVIGNNENATVNFPEPMMAGTADANGNFIGGATNGVLDVADILETDAMGVPILADNGGPTFTHALVLPSPGNVNFAIDNGAAQTALLDQRGITRTLGDGTVDVGAYEFGGFFVDSTIDSVDVTPGDGVVADNFGRKTLRAAIMEVNELANAGTSMNNAIMLDNATYDLSLIELDTTAPTVDIVNVTPDPLGDQMSGFDQIDTISFQFDEPVLNVDITDLSLSFDDGTGPVAVSLAGATLTQDPADITLFTLSDLQTLLENDGLYEFDVNVSDITDFEFNALAEDVQLLGSGVGDRDSFTRGPDVFAPTVVVSMVATNRTTNPGVIDINFSEDIFGLSLSSGTPNFTLTYNDGTGPQLVALNQVAVQQLTFSQYQLDLTPVMDFNGLTDIGSYTLTLDSALLAIQDFSGNLFTGTTSQTWTVIDDTIAPVGTFDPVTPSPRIGSVGDVVLNFDEAVMGVDLLSAETDFDLSFDPDGPGIIPAIQVDLSNIVVVEVTDSQYTIDLSTVTLEDGDYTLTLVAADGMINDQAMNIAMTTNALVADASVSFTIAEDAGEFGDLDVTDGTLAIFGSTAGNSIIDANQIDRVFDVFAGVALNFTDVTITGGNAREQRDGGGLRNAGTVNLTTSSFSNNTAGATGGGVYNDGSLVITESSFIANTADFGGGVFSNSGTVILTEATLSNNTALTDGGGFYNDRQSSVSVSGSIVTGNAASQDGGGIYNNDSATATITDSTISNNIAGGDGGGVYSEQAAMASLTNTNIAFNQAANGGGLFNQGGTVSVALSTFSANTSSQDGAGFYVSTSGNLNANDSTLSGNVAGRSGGGFFNAGNVTLDDIGVVDNTALDGGGIGNTSNLTVTAGMVSGNLASGDGGGIANTVVGILTLNSTLIGTNVAGDEGGAIYNANSAGFTLNSSTISGNSAAAAGGGISQHGTGAVSIVTSTIFNNSSTNGGGINSTEDLNVQDSTISGNSATTSGGAIFNDGGAVTLQSATVVNNTADTSGGGILNADVFGPINLKNTIVARNVAPTDTDISGTQFVAQGVTNPGNVALGFNLIGDRGTVTSVVNGIAGNLVGTTGDAVDPLLGALQDNGGPSLTHSVLFGSPARDGGTNFGVQTTDQRGFARVFDGDGNGVATVDIGSFESGFTVNTFTDSIDVNEGDRSSADAAGNSSLRAAIMEANALAGDDTILLIPGTYRLTISGRDDNSTRFGDLDVKDSLTIIGAGTDQTFIDAAQLDRVFHVLPSGRLNLKNLTILGGEEVNGGGILNQGFLTLENVIVQQNNADFGGGIFNDLLTDQLGTTTLAGASGTGTSITVTNASNLPVQTPFVVQIDTEEIQVTAINGNQLTVVRGFNGTANVGHAANAAVNLLLDATTTVISVNDSTQFSTDTPFDIRIGNEELRVVSINGNTYNVARGVNGTTAAPHLGGNTVTLVQELTITDSTITGNESRLQGGGLFNRNSSTALVRVNIDGNNSNDQGGGLFNRGSLTIVDSTFDGNVASGTGGAIYNDGINNAVSRITLSSSTLSNNVAGAKGGAIYNNDLITIVNSTISGNQGNATGGAIFNTQTSDGSALPGNISITNSTITNNATDNNGGGVVNSDSNPLNRIDVVNSIIAGNNALMADNDLIGTFNSLGANLIGESDGSNGFTNNVNLDLVGTIASPFDPVIGNLADNGGPTQTHKLLTGSPAIDSGNNSGGDPVDQRGGRRPTDTTADIGAFEIQENRLSINNLTQAEGDTGSIIFTFAVVLENPTAEPISVDYQTVQDTAKAGSDFLPQSGTLVFAPGDVTQTIAIEVNGDISIEPDEQFFILLSNSVNAELPATATQAVGTILNDDTSLTISNVDIREGDSSSSSNLTFTVDLSQPTVETVTVTYQTADNTANAGADYTSTSGTLVFASGEQVKTFDVVILGDDFLEANESFFANVTSAVDGAGNNILISNGSATGTINNDEVSVSISFSDANMNNVLDLNEGNTGTTPFDFSIDLDQPVDATVTIDVSTIDDTAIGGSDFVARMDTLVFTPGQTSQTFTVAVNGDTSFETDEDFFVTLANATRDGVVNPTAAIGMDATGRILNDEPLPDEYLIIRNGAMVEVYLNDPTMAGAPLQTGDLVTQLVVNGDNGGIVNDDIFIVDYSAGDPIPTVVGMPGIVVNGLDQSAGDSLIIRDGSVTDVIYTSENSNDGMIQIDAKLIEYNGLEPITDNLSADTRTFEFHAGDHTIRVSDDTAISGNSIVDSNQTSAFESVSFANPNVSLTINAGTGNNTITMTALDAGFGGATTIAVNGQDGNDTVNATTFDRAFTLNGGAGDDVLNGGTAGDVIIGGLGIDIIDGGAGDDTIRGNDAINPDDDAADQLSGGAGADNIQGEGGNDVIDGGSENDVLDGGSGNDVVTGGTGNDNIDGGTGDDALTGDAGDDVITGQSGMDAIDGGAGDDNVSGGDDDDVVNGGTDNDIVSGGSGDDVVGGGTGNDDVHGDEGSDTLSGGGGMDSLDGGTGIGIDQVSETAVNDQDITLTDMTIVVAGVTTTHTNIDEFILTGGDLSNVIDASAYSGSVIASGGAGNDTIRGSGGNDVLSGDAGNDVLIGNDGNDTATGGDGNDSIDGGDGNDNLSGNGESDTINGGLGNDVLFGDIGNDLLSGNEGDDILQGVAGADTLNGGADQDMIFAGDGNDLADGGIGDDTIDGQAGDDVLLGGDGGDIMIGNTGDDFIDGGEGPDTGLGSMGVDTMVAGNGNDFYDGQGTAGDVIIIATTAQNDSIAFTQNGAFTRFALVNQTPFTVDFRRTEQIRLDTQDGDDVVTVADLVGASRTRLIIDFGNGNDTLDGIANTNPNVAMSAFGRAGMDTLISGAGVDDLDGGADNDLIDSQAGMDTASGGDGDDVVIGGLDTDTINGDMGNDILIGGSGTDLMNGGDGNDFMRGNGGKDTMSGGDGNDTMYGDQSGDFIQGDAGNDQLAGRAGNDVLFGGDGADRIIGEDGSDFIIGGKGDDVISGGRNNDSIIGDLGNDVIFGNEDNDFLFGSGGADLIVGGDDIDMIKGQGSNQDVLLLGNGSGDPGSLDDKILLANDEDEVDNAFVVDQLLIDLLNF